MSMEELRNQWSSKKSSLGLSLYSWLSVMLFAVS